MSLSEAFEFFKRGLKSRMDLRRKMIHRDDVMDLEEELIRTMTHRNEEDSDSREEELLE